MKITPKMIHQAYVVAMPDEWGKPTDYEGVTEAAKVRYAVMADWLNAQLAAPAANNICKRRPDDALLVSCETLDCELFAAYDCYPAVAPGVTSLLTKIALCEQHAREADPGLQREAQHG